MEADFKLKFFARLYVDENYFGCELEMEIGGAKFALCVYL